MPSCDYTAIFCKLVITVQFFYLALYSMQLTKSVKNNQTPHCIPRGKVMAWTEDQPRLLFFSSIILFFLCILSLFLTSFITFLSACCQQCFSFILSSVACPSLLFVFNKGVEYFPPVQSQVASRSGPPSHCTVHFLRRGECNQPFGFTVQLSDRLWNISGAFK